MKRLICIVVTFAIMLSTASVASANSTCQAYSSLCSVVANASANHGGGTSGTNGPGTGAGGSLPFTGMDVGLLACTGGLLMGLGLVVRRSTRRRATEI